MATKTKKTKLASNRRLNSLSKAWLPGAILFALVFVVGGIALLRSSQASAYCKDHNHTWSNGSSGSCVTDIQEMVNGIHAVNDVETGYGNKDYFGKDPYLSLDGQFGPKTLTDVKDAQRYMGQTVIDGAVGSHTWYYLCHNTNATNLSILSPSNGYYRQAKSGHLDACQESF